MLYRDISVLLATGLAAGVLVFLTLGAGVICFAMQRKQRYQLRRQHMAASSEAAAEPKNRMHMEMVEVNDGAGDESVEATNSWPTGNPTVASDNNRGDGGADQVDANNDRENLCPERQDDSGCGGSTRYEIYFLLVTMTVSTVHCAMTISFSFYTVPATTQTS